MKQLWNVARSVAELTMEFALLALAMASTAGAKTVMLNGDIRLETVAPGQHFHVGDHHKFRIFYDDATVDPNTHIVKPIFMQHNVTMSWDNAFMLHGQWGPAHLDPAHMVMTDCFLDLSAQPYRFHHKQTTGLNGASTLFDENARTFTARDKDGSIVISGPYTIDTTPAAGPDVEAVIQEPLAPVLDAAGAAVVPHIVMLNGDIIIDYVAGTQRANVGDHHKFRLFYDEAAVDPVTHRVKPLLMQHNVVTARDNPFMIHGQWSPSHPDAVKMPMDDIYLDLSSQPYRLHYKDPHFGAGTQTTLFDENARTFSASMNSDNSVVFLGHYTIDTRPATGPDVLDVVRPSRATAGAAASAK